MELENLSHRSEELWSLKERAKELRCIYTVAAALSRREEPPQQVFRWVLDAIPEAWQYPEDTTARIQYFGRSHARPNFIETSHRLRSPISIWRTPVGATQGLQEEQRNETTVKAACRKTSCREWSRKPSDLSGPARADHHYAPGALAPSRGRIIYADYVSFNSVLSCKRTADHTFPTANKMSVSNSSVTISRQPNPLSAFTFCVSL